MEVLLQNFQYITVPMVIIWAIGGRIASVIAGVIICVVSLLAKIGQK